jgi:hypothetical protein
MGHFFHLSSYLGENIFEIQDKDIDCYRPEKLPKFHQEKAALGFQEFSCWSIIDKPHRILFKISDFSC